MENNSTKIGDLLTELVQKNKFPVSRLSFGFMILMLCTILVLSIFLWRIVSDQSRRDEIDSLLLAGGTIASHVEERLSAISVHVTHLTDLPAKNMCNVIKKTFAQYPELSECTLLDEKNTVIEACANPNAMGETTRPKGHTVKNATSVGTIQSAQSNHSSIYSKPYLNAAIGGPYTDLAVPLSNNRSVLARVSLPMNLRLSATNVLNRYQRFYLVESGKIHTRTLVDGKAPQLESMAVRLNLAPLPTSVELGLTSSILSSYYSTNLYAWSALGLLAGLFIAVITLLWIQVRRVRVEQEMQARILVQEAVSRSFRDGLCVLDKQGKILYTNKALDKLFGVESGAYVGLTPPYPFWPKTNKNVIRVFNECLTKKGAAGGEFEIEAIREDGTKFDCDVQIFPVVSNGNTIGFMATHSNITEANRARKELRNMQERFTRVLETIDAAVSVTSQNGKELLFANPIYIHEFGETNEAHLRLMSLRSDSKDITRDEEIFDDVKGRWYLVRAKKITWIDESVAEILTSYDVTERHQTEELIKEQLQKAELSANLINMGEMASSMAHELNQPLAAVQNYASGAKTLLDTGRLTTAGTGEALEKIITQTKRAAVVMQRIRNFGKRAEPIVSEVPVSQMVNEVLELTSITARKMKVKVETQIEENLPHVLCDTLLIEQVLTNLIKNAIEASVDVPHAVVTLSISSQNDNILFAVADRGGGLSEETREKLFEPFFSTKENGMGIGLNLCRSIIENHNAHLKYEENPAGGSVFSFALPAKTR